MRPTLAPLFARRIAVAQPAILAPTIATSYSCAVLIADFLRAPKARASLLWADRSSRCRVCEQRRRPPTPGAPTGLAPSAVSDQFTKRNGKSVNIAAPYRRQGEAPPTPRQHVANCLTRNLCCCS